MPVPAKSKALQDHFVGENDLSRYVPKEFARIVDPQIAIPGIAKDSASIRLIESAIQHVPTSHSLHLGDARDMPSVKPESVHLVLTSPPYWTLKEYRDS